MSYNTAVRILVNTGYLPFNMLMGERFILLVKECMNISSGSVLRLCGLLTSNEVEFVHMNVRYQVDSSLSKYNIKDTLHNAFVNNVILLFLEIYLYLFICFYTCLYIFFYLSFYANKGFYYYFLYYY